MSLILMGYMGSGKSTVGKKLASVLGYDFIDFDTYIEEKLQMSIHSIFKTKGEVYFRTQEMHLLSEVVSKENTVIALGGGTPCYGHNFKIIEAEAHTITIYLKASIQSLVDRLFTKKSNRPLIAHLETRDDLAEFIGKHLFERAPVYEQSDIVITTDGLSEDAVVASIIAQLF